MNTSCKLLLAAALVAGAGLPAAFAAPAVVHSTVNGHRFHDGKVKVTFSQGRRHASLAAVKLDVYDARGRDVFSRVNAGPRADLRLPAGHYRVVAHADGMRRSTQVNVRPGQATSVDMHWPRQHAA